MPGLCGLRHDVDHDLDLALEMAHFEHARGFSSTYFILPGTKYWRQDVRMVDKLLQLQDYGHEVGLHVNSIVEWVLGETDDITESILSQLMKLRNSGLVIHGIAAHGDKRCYEYNLNNYWCFEELRPTDPYTAENGRTAEGVFDTDLQFCLQYPPDHTANRADGRVLGLWSVNMNALGLEYHAWHTRFDNYFSDSGGKWKRSTDPMLSTRGNDRWQVLIHPEYWRGKRKYYFFLSSARSGSTWLSEVLTVATPLQTRHEYLLNQPFHRNETSRKPTTDIWALEDNPNEVRARLIEAWEEFELGRCDFAEVNVYLENFTSQLKAVFPEAVFIHLKRDTALVVSSLMDRNWYDTPVDRHHPRLQSIDAYVVGQFERVCHYVMQADKRLDSICKYCIHLDELTKSPQSLANAFDKLNIVYHPRLGEYTFKNIINARKNIIFPNPDRWSDSKKKLFINILSNKKESNISLYYKKIKLYKKYFNIYKVKRFIIKFFRNHNNLFKYNKLLCLKMRPHNCNLQIQNDKIVILVDNDNKSNSYVVIGGSNWKNLTKYSVEGTIDNKNINKSSGWKVHREKYIEGLLLVDIPDVMYLTFFLMSYNQSGELIYKRKLGVMELKHPFLEFSATPHPDAMFVDFIIYMPAKFKNVLFEIKSFEFEWV